jgi:hypothetical protein
MPLHLIKLCVGADSIEDLEDWVASCIQTRGRQIHTTRMMPTRRDEILAGGSLYWVIKGQLSCRQAILALDAVRDSDGISRCQIVLDSKVVPVDIRPRGPFQGWRYFEEKDAPQDLMVGSGLPGELPLELQRELRMIGVL